MIPILIPAYNPDNKLTKLVDDLIERGAGPIIIINDGSDPESAGIFQELSKKKKCETLTHAVNLGKGRALKTGINHTLGHYPTLTGVVTADADGQHTPDDIMKVVAALRSRQKSVILGCRQFGTDVPLRSLLGNSITKFVFAFLVGRKISDTQTGLRGLPRRFLPACMHLSGERYEYEMNMLIETRRERIPIEEVPIETVYIDSNRSSHFNPFFDSIRIYFLIIRFSFSSMATSFIDFVLFTGVYYTTRNILTSIVLARIFAATFNFVINKRFVFIDRGRTTMELVKYALLVAFLGGVTYITLTMLVDRFHWNVVLTKAMVETLLFLVSFSIQREFVFRGLDVVMEEED